MHQHLGNETCQEVLVQAHGEAEASPVVSVLEAVESIALEIDLASEILLVEGFHGDLALAMVLGAVMGAVEVEIVLDRTTRVLGLFILSRGDRRSNSPEDHQDRDRSEDGEEDGSIETSAHLAGQVPRNTDEQRDQEDIGEAVAARSVRRKRSILDCGILESITMRQQWH